MPSVVVLSALAVAAVNVAAALLGALRWWQVEPSDAFWRLLRAGQVLAVAFAIGCGIAGLAGRTPDDGLFWLYVALPLAIASVAEQLRLVSAQTVLEARGLESAAEMHALGEAEQRSIVLAIVRREIGVMALGAGTVAFLLVRAAGTASGF